MTALTGQGAIITGAARGIGFAIAEALATEGAAVMLADLDETAVRDATAKLADQGLRCSGQAVDVTDSDSVAALAERTLSEFGSIDVLVNNAGIWTTGSVIELSLDEWNRMIQSDLTSVFLCSRAVLPAMMEQQRGRIINVSSQVATKGAALMAHYCAAKAGVDGFTRALAREVAEHNITVNVIAPGPTDTPLLRSGPEEWLEFKRRDVPLRRLASPQEIAPTAVLLASDGGAYYTGATFNISGGDVM